MDPIAILEKAWNVFKIVKQLVDENASADESLQELSENLMVHETILKNIDGIKSPTFAVIVKQYSTQMSKLEKELTSRQGTGFIKKLKAFATSASFLQVTTAIEDKMMKIQVTLLTVIGTNSLAASTAPAPPYQSMEDGITKSGPTSSKHNQIVPMPPSESPTQTASATDTKPSTTSHPSKGLTIDAADGESSVEFSASELAEIRGKLSQENVSKISSAPVVKRGWITCEACAKPHRYDLKWQPIATFCYCAQAIPYVGILASCFNLCAKLMCPEFVKPQIVYQCPTTNRTINAVDAKCPVCSQKHKLEVSFSKIAKDEGCCKAICCGPCIPCWAKGAPYIQHDQTLRKGCSEMQHTFEERAFIFM